ncbi:MAG: chemotaxis response regulator protein-glutamate methylesterase [Opitutales bacterium]|nr:chemotaxis response regulator protein-glutamate methylesterase [Opitutales bacterium]
MISDPASNPVRVLIVDDSAVIRSLLKRTLSKDPRIEVVGTAINPYDAHDQIRAKNPDVLTLDIEMPKMDGLTFLNILMERHPLPTIVMSSISQKGSSQAMEALKLGAVDVLAKPSGSEQLSQLLGSLADRIVEAASAKVGNRERATVESNTHLDKVDWQAVDPDRLILLGASTGGTEALNHVIRQLPADCPPILVVQHIPAYFSKAFADRLNSTCDLEVREAVQGDQIEPGTVLIAPGDYHMILDIRGKSRKVRLTQTSPVCYQRPAVDVLFRSALPYAPHVVSGILTGMGRDGAEGLLRLREAGARTLGQDEASCVVYGMPKAAFELGACEQMKSLGSYAQHLLQLLQEQPRTRSRHAPC